MTSGWSAEMMMSNTVVGWEPPRHVRWLDESGWMGPGTAMAIDYHLSMEKGKTRVRLVQSAFGASDGWDDLFASTEVGWTYFLYNLRVYLETHRGRVRTMIAERLEASVPRSAFWRHLLGKVTSWTDLEPPLIGAVEELIDFVTEPPDA